jgi:threonylcarbamoyladenosine tRNA methylthiotransferase MtaB
MMNRKYTRSTYWKTVNRIIENLGPVGLGTDVIVGFPGETGAAFEETCRFVESLPFTYLHVFPFSARQLTKASHFPNQIDNGVKTERAGRLRKIGQKKRNVFLEEWRDKRTTVLFESKDNSGLMSGLNSEYLRVEVPFEEAYANQFKTVAVDTILHESVRGTVID